MRLRGLLLTSALLSILPGSLHAAVYVVPTDSELVASADGIVRGRVVRLEPQYGANGDIVTAATIEIDETFKGKFDRNTVIIRDDGGVIGNEGMFVSDGVSYQDGEHVVAFLQNGAAGWRTWGSALGKFREMTAEDGTQYLQRGPIVGFNADGTTYHDFARNEPDFLAFIRGRRRATATSAVTGSNVESQGLRVSPDAVNSTPYFVKPAYAVAPLQSTYPASAYTQGNFRWDLFDRGGSVGFYVSGTQSGYDSIGAAQRGLAAWTNEPNSNVNYYYAGTNSAAFVKDGVNTIVYNSASDVPAGAIGYSKWYTNATHVYKGETFYSISEGDVAIKSGLSVPTTVFEEAVTHELGHTLGFRHSDQGTPASSDAVMVSVLTGHWGANLAPWDRDAVSTVYALTTTTTPPPPSTDFDTRTFSGDFNGDGRSDVLLQNSSTGDVAVWLTNGFTVTAGAVVGNPGTAYRVVGSGDFNGDGRSDILLQNQNTGEVAMWLMNGFTITSGAVISSPGTSWRVATTGDLNGDGRADIILQNTSSNSVAAWMMSGFTLVSGSVVSTPGTGWRVVTAGDFNGDLRADILLQNSGTGAVAVWLMNGSTIASGGQVNTPGTAWHARIAADVNGDGRADIILQNVDGSVAGWLMNGLTVSSGAVFNTPGTAWHIAVGGDFNGDGRKDIVLQNVNGDVAEWQMNGLSVSAGAVISTPGPTWRVVGY
jgi:hypothetical protein